MALTTNGIDQTAQQTIRPQPTVTPKYASMEDIYRQYTPDDSAEYQRDLDYAQTHRGLYAVTDVVAHLGNLIAAAQGATPQQLPSVSAANADNISRLRTLRDNARSRYISGLTSAAMADAQMRNRLKQQAQEAEQARAYREEQLQQQQAELAERMRQFDTTQGLRQQQLQEDARQFNATQGLRREQSSVGRAAAAPPDLSYHWLGNGEVAVSNKEYAARVNSIKAQLGDALTDEQRAAYNAEIAQASVTKTDDMPIVLKYAYGIPALKTYIDQYLRVPPVTESNPAPVSPPAGQEPVVEPTRARSGYRDWNIPDEFDDYKI